MAGFEQKGELVEAIVVLHTGVTATAHNALDGATLAAINEKVSEFDPHAPASVGEAAIVGFAGLHALVDGATGYISHNVTLAHSDTSIVARTAAAVFSEEGAPPLAVGLVGANIGLAGAPHARTLLAERCGVSPRAVDRIVHALTLLIGNGSLAARCLNLPEVQPPTEDWHEMAYNVSQTSIQRVIDQTGMSPPAVRRRLDRVFDQLTLTGGDPELWAALCDCEYGRQDVTRWVTGLLTDDSKVYSVSPV